MILWKINGILYSCNSKALMWSSPPSRWSRHSSPPLPHCSFGRRSLRNPHYVVLLGGSEWSNCKIVSALQSISKQMANIILIQRYYPQHCSYLAYFFLSLFLSLSLSLSLTLPHKSINLSRWNWIFAFCSCIVSCVSCVSNFVCILFMHCFVCFVRLWNLAGEAMRACSPPKSTVLLGHKTCAQNKISKLCKDLPPPPPRII